VDDKSRPLEDVISTLMRLAGQNTYQAEQCAIIAHTKGEYLIKSGKKKELEDIRFRMNEEGFATRIA